MRPAWFPDWSGHVAAVVAAGESATQDVVDRLRGRCRVAVVNNSFRLAPWADLLYAADDKWWDANREAYLFAGLKVTPSEAVATRYKLNHIRMPKAGDAEKDSFLFDDHGFIGRGGNGGFQTSNLVMQFGVMSLIWVGIDCRGDHWHGKHQQPLRNPTPQRLQRWADVFDAQAPLLEKLGIRIINCSAISAVKAYPVMTVDEALKAFNV